MFKERLLRKLAGLEKPGWTITLTALVKAGKIKSVEQAVAWFKKQAGREPRPGEMLNIYRILRKYG